MTYEDFTSSIGEHIYDFLEYYKPVWVQSTYEHHRWHLLSLDSFLTERDFSGKDIDEATVTLWIKSLPPLADSTLQGYISSVRELFEYLSAREICRCYIPPVRAVNQDYLPHYFTDSELDDMYGIIDDYPIGHRNKLPYIKAELPMVIRILESCGTRISETVSLQMKDVDLDRGVLTMMHAKGDKERYVPMSESLSQVLRKYRAAMGIIGKPDAFLFPRTDQSEHLDKYEIENRFPYIRKWTGIEANRTRKFERNICLHCFRHCFTIRSFKKLKENDVHMEDAIPYLSIYLGHNKLKETEKYLSFSAEMYPDELENFENIMETNLPDDAMWDNIYEEVINVADFMIRFLICNVFISGIIGILLIAKRIFKNNLSSRMQYNLWFLLLGLLAVPFIPFRLIGFPQIFSWLGSLRSSPASGTGTAMGEAVRINPTGNADWMNDFTLSVNSETPSIARCILLGIWIVGILAMIILVIKSSLRLRSLEKSALPLQNKEVRRLYNHCLEEMGIHRDIPVYSTAFLKSPIIVGLLKPCIYLPIHLISDYNESDMRYMLLHELQHYKHHDAIASYLMNLARVVYWFNPLVWYALKEMRNDREVACDTSVLKMLEEDDYEDYGNTLINFAEKVSLTPFPFVAGLGGNMKQMKRRIINIASYEKPTFMKRLKGVCSYFLIACLLFIFMPMLSVNAAIEMENTYQINKNDSNISYIDLSSYFNDYQGCFVLFDATTDSWQIYNKAMAQKRISPDSTYKIYSALLGLENRYITSASSEMTWNGQEYPIAEWNANQNLTTAFQNSVNWYFQSLDQTAGLETLEDFYTYINYGNHDLSGGISSYWAESSLKISPIEQVEMLQRLYINEFNFDADNIQTVKNALLLSSTANGNLYGKTGTGNINGENISGWFIGYVETSDNTYFFALNIGATENATGSKASDIALSILSDMNIWY